MASREELLDAFKAELERVDPEVVLETSGEGPDQTWTIYKFGVEESNPVKLDFDDTENMKKQAQKLYLDLIHKSFKAPEGMAVFSSEIKRIDPQADIYAKPHDGLNKMDVALEKLVGSEFFDTDVSVIDFDKTNTDALVKEKAHSIYLELVNLIFAGPQRFTPDPSSDEAEELKND